MDLLSRAGFLLFSVSMLQFQLVYTRCLFRFVSCKFYVPNFTISDLVQVVLYAQIVLWLFSWWVDWLVDSFIVPRLSNFWLFSGQWCTSFYFFQLLCQLLYQLLRQLLYQLRPCSVSNNQSPRLLLWKMAKNCYGCLEMPCHPKYKQIPRSRLLCFLLYILEAKLWGNKSKVEI